MNRVEIKEMAKQKVKGNKWKIWWPVLLISLIEGIITAIFAPQIDMQNIKIENIPTSYLIITSLVSIVSFVVMAGYYKYLLNFVRTGKFEAKTILNTAKEKWLRILIASILVTLIVTICSFLLVIPGIIMSFAYTFAIIAVVDDDISASEALKASRKMMKGFKMDYFVFTLSFIGWIILMPFTLGLLAIWLVPYMSIATILYYDKLKSLQK